MLTQSHTMYPLCLAKLKPLLYLLGTYAVLNPAMADSLAGDKLARQTFSVHDHAQPSHDNQEQQQLPLDTSEPLRKLPATLEYSPVFQVYGKWLLRYSLELSYMRKQSEHFRNLC